MTLTVHEKLALDAARVAQARAHAPYSGKHVGAAVVTEDGHVFSACNVENADSSLRVCAERNAVAQAIASGYRRFESIIVIAPDERFWPPCDLCRAVILEFADNPRVVLSSRRGELHVDNLLTVPLLPFSADSREPGT